MTTPEKCYSAGMMCKRMNTSFEASDFCGEGTELQADNTCGVSETMRKEHNTLLKLSAGTTYGLGCSLLTTEEACNVPGVCTFDTTSNMCAYKEDDPTPEEEAYVKSIFEFCETFGPENCPVEETIPGMSFCKLENDECVRK